MPRKRKIQACGFTRREERCRAESLDLRRKLGGKTCPEQPVKWDRCDHAERQEPKKVYLVSAHVFGLIKVPCRGRDERLKHVCNTVLSHGCASDRYYCARNGHARTRQSIGQPLRDGALHLFLRERRLVFEGPEPAPDRIAHVRGVLGGVIHRAFMGRRVQHLAKLVIVLYPSLPLNDSRPILAWKIGRVCFLAYDGNRTRGGRLGKRRRACMMVMIEAVSSPTL